jgi:hypothetical protein
MPTCFLAQGEYLFLHAAHDRVGFNKDHCPHEDQGINLYLFLLYYFLFAQYLYANQTKCHVSMGINIAPWLLRPWRHHCLSNVIASMTRQRHRAMANVISAAVAIS